jgi:uncharacterized caspase-like protein
MKIRVIPSLSMAFLVVMIGCASEPATTRIATSEAQNADDLLVIDCLLAGQVRKLGQNLTYLSPRRAVKTTAVDCEIRGGEYVAYDRASYATALKIWLPQATQGDPAAQTYVGEIYEKGLGTDTDYTLAANWYRKAAQQGYSRAQINLGYLYESGLGVQRNLASAMNLYREASGLKDGKVEFVSSVQATQREAAARQTASLKQEVSQLSTELAQAQDEIQRRKVKLKASERDLSILKQQLDSERLLATPAIPATVSAGSDTASRSELEQQLTDAQNDRQRLIAKLAEEQLKVGVLKQELHRSEDQLADRRYELEALQKQLTETRTHLDQEKEQSAARVDQSEVLQMQSKLDHIEAVVMKKKAEIALLETEKQNYQKRLHEEHESAAGREQAAQRELEERNREVIALKMELSESSDVLSSVERKLRETEEEQERLTEKLAAQQLDAHELRKNLDTTSRALEVRQNALKATQTELARTQQALELRKAQQTTESTQEVTQLEDRILRLNEKLQGQHRELLAIEEESSDQQTRLSSKLAQAELNGHELQHLLNTRNQEISSLQTQLASAKKQIARAAGSDEKIAELEQELVRNEKEIARQREEISSIEANLAQPDDGRQEVAFASFVAARNVGPSIEIIEPPVAVMRGKPSIPLHSNLSELEIIGRVSPADKLISFRINDQPRETDKTGLFQVAVPVTKPDTPIRAVAVDREGRRASLDFLIIPKMDHESNVTETRSVELAPSTKQNVEFGEYHALVIGNNNYDNMTNLHTARNDAEAVAQLLKTKYGFKTNLLLDADRYDILSTLNKLMQELTEEDNLLIYYAGHGELDNINLRGYWLPVDAEQGSSTNWISNVTVTDMLNVMSVKHVLVVADSCYSGSLTRSSVPRLQAGMSDNVKMNWYKAMSKARTRVVLTSGGVEPVLDSGGGQHSIFAQAFLEVLEQNNGILEGYRLYRDVQTRVKRSAAAVRMGQDPQYAPIKYAGHEAGEFFFRPDGSASNDWLNDHILAINRAPGTPFNPVFRRHAESALYQP